MDRFDLHPHLFGELLELRPMRPEDWEALFAVAADPLIWEAHPARERYREERFRDYFEEGSNPPVPWSPSTGNPANHRCVALLLVRA